MGKNYFIGKNANTGNHSSSSSYGLGFDMSQHLVSTVNYGNLNPDITDS